MRIITLPQPEVVNAILAKHDAAMGALDIATALSLGVRTVQDVIGEYRPQAAQPNDPLHALASDLRGTTHLGRLSQREVVTLIGQLIERGLFTLPKAAS